MVSGRSRAQVLTNCNNGQTYNATLNRQDNTQNKKYEDGNLLLGGWSKYDKAVDAGLIYNKGLQPASLDDYSAFYAIENTPRHRRPADDALGIQFDHSTGNRSNWKIPCNDQGRYTSITFFADQPLNSPGSPNYPLNYVELVTQYQYFDKNIQGPRAIDLIYVTQSQNDDWEGWNPSCDGCVFKRETTIAQRAVKSGGPGDVFNNGDSFTGAWFNTSLSCGFSDGGCTDPNRGLLYAMRSINIKACEEYPAWGNYSDDTRDCSNSAGPVGGVSQHIKVSQFGYDHEVDYIDLNPIVADAGPTPTPAPTPMGQTLIFTPLWQTDSDGLRRRHEHRQQRPARHGSPGHEAV